MKFSTALVALASASSAMAFAPISAPQKSTALNGVLGKITGQSSLDPAVVAKFDSLPYPKESIMAEYVWVDAVGNTRSKTRTLTPDRVKSVDALPSWNFDGSSTDQAPGDDSEVILKPQRIFNDPFRPRSDGQENILVMCDTYTPAGEPLESNTRAFGKSL
jgi:glutamine synthetase